MRSALISMLVLLVLAAPAAAQTSVPGPTGTDGAVVEAAATPVATVAAATPTATATAAQDDSSSDDGSAGDGSDDQSDDTGDDQSDDDGSDDSTCTDDSGADVSDPCDFDDTDLGGGDQSDPCSSDTGGDYDYCAGCRSVGAEGDYTDYSDYGYYCPLEESAAGTGGGPTVLQKGDVAPATAAVAEELPAGTLPMTGGRPVVILMLGLAFVMIGAGGRLRLSRR